MEGNRRHIPVSVKETIVVLSSKYPSSTIAIILDVSQRTVNRVLELSRQTGHVVRTPLEQGRHRVLKGLHATFLESFVERTPDALLCELRDALYDEYGIWVSEKTISRTLRRRGFTRKRITAPAMERNEDRRAEFQIRIATLYRARQLVFVDESACNRFTTKRTMAWSPTGNRARRHDYFVRGTRYSILPALSLSGVLHLDVQDHSYKAVDFNAFIEGLLDNMNPFPLDNSVIIMDNASIHKSQELRDMVEARGMRIEYLPAYSPDYNPIEEGFSAMKYGIRANRDYVRGELTGEVTCDPYEMLWVAVFSSMTAEKAEGWFRDSGYLA